MDHLSIYEIALYLHASESVIGAPVAPALGVDTEVGALNSACSIFKHATSFECGSHLGLPDNPVFFIKVSFKSFFFFFLNLCLLSLTYGLSDMCLPTLHGGSSM